MVPGWCCDERSLAPLVAILRRSRPVLVVDLPGHGGVPAAPDEHPVTLVALAGHVLGWLAERDLGPCCLVGHSMGAVVALICGTRPDLVASVVALDPSPLLDRRGRQFFSGAVDQVAADSDGAWRRRFVERLLRRPEGPGAAALMAAFLAVPPPVAAAECQAIAQVDARSVLAGVAVPTLLVTAGDPERGLVDALPGAHVGRVVGSGHFVGLEAADQVAPMLERFLEICGSSPGLRSP